MSSLRLLLLVVVFIWLTVAVGEPLRANKIRREVRPRPRQTFLTQGSIVLPHTPDRALLYSSKPRIPALANRLPDNYTLILKEPLVDTFTCQGRGYGYYGDVDNNCQIFHVCLPLKDIFPNAIVQDITYHFSFICNNHTIFSQDSMTCAWEEEAVPCEATPDLYWMNENFFRKIPDPDGDGEKYAEVNTPL